MPIENFHECVRFAGVIDIVSAVAAAASVQTPAVIHFTDSEHLAVRTPASFSVCDLLSSVFRDLVSSFERHSGEAASAVDRRRFDG